MCHAARCSLQIVFINQLELVLVSVFHVPGRSWTKRAQEVERQQVEEGKGRWREAPSLKSLLEFYLKWRTQITFWGEGQPGEEDLNTWKQKETNLIKKKPAEKIQGCFRITVVRYYHTLKRAENSLFWFTSTPTNATNWDENRGCGMNSFTRRTLAQ